MARVPGDTGGVKVAERRVEIVALQETLKQLIAAKGLRVSDMVDQLGISIATAKRVLNGEDLSIDRVLELCDWIDIPFQEVVEMSSRRRAEYHYCSEIQEEFLAKHVSHFAFLKALQRGEDIEAIARSNDLSQSDIDAYLLDLESHGFLKRPKDDKIELIVKDGLDWRPNGALWKAYYGRWSEEIVEHMRSRSTDDQNITVDLFQRKFSCQTIADLRKEVSELSRKYAAISRLERRVYDQDKLVFYTMSILGDAWVAPMYRVEAYRKMPILHPTSQA
ncbi:MAG: helix-turn-helix transcriptional regulator [Proteobacteria bacterium]|nr:helix-turn-helix transcriptional regulator [Pseudomonadota bacterium]